MEQVTVDQVVQETLFEKERSGKSIWKFCNQITYSRLEVVFFVQIVILMLIVLCIVKLTVFKLFCEDFDQFGLRFYRVYLDISYQTLDYEQNTPYQ